MLLASGCATTSAILQRATAEHAQLDEQLLDIELEERWRMRKSYDHDDFVAVCSELTIAVPSLRSQAEASCKCWRIKGPHRLGFDPLSSLICGGTTTDPGAYRRRTPVPIYSYSSGPKTQARRERIAVAQRKRRSVIKPKSGRDCLTAFAPFTRRVM